MSGERSDAALQTKTLAKIIASNLRAVRIAHGYTQEEFATAAGVAASQIGSGEKNRFQIPASRLCRISQVTGIPVLEFFKGIDLLDLEFDGTNLTEKQKGRISEIIGNLHRDNKEKGHHSAMRKKQDHTPRKANNLDAIIAKNIRKIRQSRKYPQKKLAEELGVTGSQMCQYEAGGNRMPAAKLCRISQILGVPLLDFFKGIDLADNRVQKQSLAKDKTDQIIDIIDEVPGGGDGNIRVIVLNNAEA